MENSELEELDTGPFQVLNLKNSAFDYPFLGVGVSLLTSLDTSPFATWDLPNSVKSKPYSFGYYIDLPYFYKNIKIELEGGSKNYLMKVSFYERNGTNPTEKFLEVQSGQKTNIIVSARNFFTKILITYPSVFGQGEHPKYIQVLGRVRLQKSKFPNTILSNENLFVSNFFDERFGFCAMPENPLGTQDFYHGKVFDDTKGSLSISKGSSRIYYDHVYQIFPHKSETTKNSSEPLWYLKEYRDGTGGYFQKLLEGYKTNGKSPYLTFQKKPPILYNTQEKLLNPNSDFYRKLEDRAPIATFANGPLEYSDQNLQTPSSYEVITALYYQVAARFGSNAQIPVSNISLSENQVYTGEPYSQEKKSGLGLIKEMGVCANEPDGAWKFDAEGYWEPEWVAACMSKAYDNHCNPGIMGIKNADPSIQVGAAALAGFNKYYLVAMRNWFDTQRRNCSVRYPFDILHIHHYNNTTEAGQSTDWNKKALPPELSNFQEKLVDFKVFATKYFPGKKLYLGETGYDSNSQSPQGAVTIGEYLSEEVQGFWILRSYLFFLAAKWDKFFLYSLGDHASENSSEQYATSGIVKRFIWDNLSQSYNKKLSYIILDGFFKELSMNTFVRLVKKNDYFVADFKNNVVNTIVKKVFWTSETKNDNQLSLKIVKISRNSFSLEGQPLCYKKYRSEGLFEEGALEDIISNNEIEIDNNPLIIKVCSQG
jgi:hypothetical protein